MAEKSELDQAMFNIYRAAKEEANYHATVFLNMLHERGGIATAKALINSNRQRWIYGPL